MFDACGLVCVRGDRPLFSHVNLRMRPGDYCELRGPNGSGKTSLLRILAGLLPPSEGDVLWRGTTIADRETLTSFRSSLAYIGHRPAVKHDLTAIENLRVSVALSGWPVSVDAARAALARLGLAGCEHLRARRLSEGQQRRLALSRLIVQPASLWLLDEVLTALDADALALVVALIGGHLERGGMAVVATHQPLVLASARSLARRHRIELAA